MESYLGCFGQLLKSERKAARRSRTSLATAARINLKTLEALERGGGSVPSLRQVMQVLGLRLAGQPPLGELGDWVRQLRRSRGMTQEELADRANLSRPTVRLIERGGGRTESLLRIMKALELAVGLVKAQQCALHHGDCIEVMRALAPGSVSLILADLPYAISGHDWDEPIDLEAFWREAEQLLTPSGTVVMMAVQPFSTQLIAGRPGLFKYTLTWEKNRPSGHLLANRMPLRSHEDIVVFSRGTIRKGPSQMTYNPQGLVALAKPVNSRNGTASRLYHGKGQLPRTEGRLQHVGDYPRSVLRFDNAKRKRHPSEKPLALFDYLIRTYSNAGDLVLDPTMGAGGCGLAASAAGRGFIGIERHPTFFGFAKQRLVNAEP